MESICEACAQNSKSHSFKQLFELNNVVTFYTCPADAELYKDTEGILKHYRAQLNTIKGKKWRWIFDCRGFTMEHALQIKTATELAKLISEQSSFIEEIQIINSTWTIQTTLFIVKPFLSNHIRNILHISK
jgi:hypothetical protein